MYKHIYAFINECGNVSQIIFMGVKLICVVLTNKIQFGNALIESCMCPMKDVTLQCDYM